MGKHKNNTKQDVSQHFVPNAPKEVEDLIIHKGPKTYRLTPEEQERRTKRLMAYKDRERAIYYLSGSLIPFLFWILSL